MYGIVLMVHSVYICIYMYIYIYIYDSRSYVLDDREIKSSILPHNAQTGFESRPPSYPIGIKFCSPSVNWPGHESACSPQIKERGALHLATCLKDNKYPNNCTCTFIYIPKSSTLHRYSYMQRWN